MWLKRRSFGVVICVVKKRPFWVVITVVQKVAILGGY